MWVSAAFPWAAAATYASVSSVFMLYTMPRLLLNPATAFMVKRIRDSPSELDLSSGRSLCVMQLSFAAIFFVCVWFCFLPVTRDQSPLRRLVAWAGIATGPFSFISMPRACAKAVSESVVLCKRTCMLRSSGHTQIS